MTAHPLATVVAEGATAVAATDARSRPLQAVAVGLLALTLAQGATAQQARTMPPFRADSFSGRVVAGESLEIALTPSLVFRLDADTVTANPPGWTVRVTAPNAPGDDFSMVATPPYRFANPRYVDTRYGITAEQALANTPREFAFVATRADYMQARAALEILLWAYSDSQTQLESASALLDALASYPASRRPRVSSRPSRPSGASPVSPACL